MGVKLFFKMIVNLIDNLIDWIDHHWHFSDDWWINLSDEELYHSFDRHNWE